MEKRSALARPRVEIKRRMITEERQGNLETFYAKIIENHARLVNSNPVQTLIPRPRRPGLPHTAKPHIHMTRLYVWRNERPGIAAVSLAASLQFYYCYSDCAGPALKELGVFLYPWLRRYPRRIDIRPGRTTQAIVEEKNRTCIKKQCVILYRARSISC